MSRIRQLPPTIFNKIAAGEVIERPASVVKELMENSVDALAQRIDVEIEAGGADLIRITDDGEGIHPDDLLLAVSSHATSKLETADDLFRIRTFGFRGEALASIAEVSRLQIRSRTPDAIEGREIRSDLGNLVPPIPCGAPVGTQIEVADLFGNVPVRRKFLKGAATEFGHIAEQFTRIALAHPRLHRALRHNGKLVYELPACANLLDRIAMFFGQDTAKKCIPVESDLAGVRIWGFVGHPNLSKATRKGQYLFLNGRWIQDRTLQHALGESYRGLVMVGRYPVCFLFIEMPPDLVDVNVHPTKSEVRFQDSQPLYRQLLAAIRTKFLALDLDSQLRMGTGSSSAAVANAPSVDPKAEVVQRELVSWARSQSLDWSRPNSSTGGNGSSAHPAPTPAAGRIWSPRDPGYAYLTGQITRPDAFTAPRDTAGPSSGDSSDDLSRDLAPLTATSLATLPAPETDPAQFPASGFDTADYAATYTGTSFETGPATSTVSPADVAALAAGSLASPATEAPQSVAPATNSAPVRAMQVHDCYLVVETEEGLTVVDQHALHERILYEQLRNRVLAGRLESQKLLIPQPIDLPAAERALLAEQYDLLAQLGLGVEDFGGSTIVVTRYPGMLSRTDPARIVRDVCDLLATQGKNVSPRDLLDSLLHMMACKAAIKAGQRLSPEEIDALLAQRHLCDDAHHCPHGRPTALTLSRNELDRQFGRLGA